ncbi:hypothetical protein [[Acholeplasma] multilocale]|uniref:hypothetical protein n=1 Tax=[Acholeplasma] multilocale TaxID=264638 RepID=UPI00047D3BA8|nr:hypothetical protein [[Acholeplasma] multilocale]
MFDFLNRKKLLVLKNKNQELINKLNKSQIEVAKLKFQKNELKNVEKVIEKQIVSELPHYNHNINYLKDIQELMNGWDIKPTGKGKYWLYDCWDSKSEILDKGGIYMMCYKVDTKDYPDRRLPIYIGQTHKFRERFQYHASQIDLVKSVLESDDEKMLEGVADVRYFELLKAKEDNLSLRSKHPIFIILETLDSNKMSKNPKEVAQIEENYIKKYNTFFKGLNKSLPLTNLIEWNKFQKTKRGE